VTSPARPWAETQPERTAQSWQRTGLGMLAVAGLLGHGSVRSDRPVLLALAGGVALIGLFVLGGLAPARRRRLHRVADADADAAAPRSMALVTGAVVLIGLTVAAAALSLR
jgi:putative membrane protein